MKIKLSSDVFDITKDIRMIDSSYFIMYNTNTTKYELHSKGQTGNSYCLTFPYDTLDARCLDYARYTRFERRKEIFDEIEKNNQLLENRCTSNMIDEAISGLKEGLRCL